MHRIADMSLWSGRLDTADGSDALRWHQQVEAYRQDAEAGQGLLGVLRG